MSDRLGFTFYPKDWWTSDTFFILAPFERYIYLELIFIMYSNEGFVKNNKNLIERRLSAQISDKVWSKITDLMVKDGDQITHESVNKRMKQIRANRENGKKGGRPRKPKKPILETHKNPPLEGEGEREGEKNKKRKGTMPAQNDFSIQEGPDKNDVLHFFAQQGIDDPKRTEMAKSFYEKWEATGWSMNGSKIKHWGSLAARFIDNWRKNEKPNDEGMLEIETLG